MEGIKISYSIARDQINMQIFKGFHEKLMNASLSSSDLETMDTRRMIYEDF